MKGENEGFGSVSEAARVAGIEDWKYYKGVRDGNLPAVPNGKRGYLVPIPALRRFLAGERIDAGLFLRRTRDDQ